VEHPIFKNIKILLIYSVMWILILGIHFTVLYYSRPFSILIDIADSIVFNLTAGFMGLVIWYVVRYSKPGKINIINLFINNLTTLFIIVLLWLGVGYSLLYLFNSGNTDYLNFLNDTIPWRIFIGLFLFAIIVLVYYLIINFENLQEKLGNEGHLKEMIKEAELNLLKSQINPHFLFNSLNSVNSLIITNPEKAQEMLIKLSDFLRYSVSLPENGFTTLHDELDNVRRYLDIEKVRFGEKLSYETFFSDDCTALKIPAMILQPLYENAIKHGVYESTGQIKIITYCEFIEGTLKIIISNNFEKGVSSKKGSGIGLKNIRERLLLIYQNNSLLKTNINNDVFEVHLIIPQHN